MNGETAGMEREEQRGGEGVKRGDNERKGLVVGRGWEKNEGGRRRDEYKWI